MPTATPVIVVPLTVHWAGLALSKVTVKPDVAVALAVVVPPPTDRVLGVKLIVPMVWLVRTEKLLVTGVAAK